MCYSGIMVTKTAKCLHKQVTRCTKASANMSRFLTKAVYEFFTAKWLHKAFGRRSTFKAFIRSQLLSRVAKLNASILTKQALAYKLLFRSHTMSLYWLHSQDPHFQD